MVIGGNSYKVLKRNNWVLTYYDLKQQLIFVNSFHKKQ